MNFRFAAIAAFCCLAVAGQPQLLFADQASQGAARKVRVTGVVKDESNNITLPGIPVEVAGAGTVYTDVDGRFRSSCPRHTRDQGGDGRLRRAR